MRNLMPGLARLGRPLTARLARRLRGDERGAVATIIVILLGFGVLTGMGAMVIDVGQIYQNRAELQNGADAGALAVAKSCALGTCNTGAAQPIAAQNAKTGTEGVNLICGSGTLGTCPASTGALIDCPPAPSNTNYVDVHTQTQMPGGSSLLPPVFARTLYGNGNYQGTTVYACSQAEWGAPSSSTGPPITVPQCVWNTGTSNGASYAATPPATPPASADMVLQLSGTSGPVSTGTSCGGAGTSGIKINYRFHDEDNSAGSWSSTNSVTTGTGPVPVTAPGGGESFNINPGDTFKVGYDFTIPGNNQALTVNWTNLLATVNFTCPGGSAGSFTISMPNYTVTVSNGSGWYPSGDESSPASYEGQITAPAACGAGQVMHQSQIAAFSGDVSVGGSSGSAVFAFTGDNGNCSATFSGSYGPYGGSGFPADCEQELAASQADHSAILIPVCATGCITTSSSYTLAGFAAFVVTGYNLPGFTASDWLKPADSCTGSEYCIDGYFTQDLVPDTGTLGGQNMGAIIVKLSG